MKFTRLFLLLFSATILLSCNKTEGEGGTSTIEGKVYLRKVDGFGNTLEEYYAADRDVYIIYGTGSKTYNDKFSTSYDGSFYFSNLTKGKYTIFAYTRCDACASGDTIVSQVVDITENKSTIDLGTIEVIK